MKVAKRKPAQESVESMIRRLRRRVEDLTIGAFFGGWYVNWGNRVGTDRRTLRAALTAALKETR